MDKYKFFLVFMTSSFLFKPAVEGSGINASYVLLAPNVARPGSDFTIQGTLLNTPSESVTLSASLKLGDERVKQAAVTISGTTDVKLDVPVPSDLQVRDNMETMELEVNATGGLSFTETKYVNFDPKSVSVYIQTDKGIYKPGQTVNFRVFVTTLDLQIVYGDLKVDIFDPKGNKINQWSVGGAELTSMKGVYQVEQVMSTEPVFGEWKIKAKLLSHGGHLAERSFNVATYVLPKFQVEVDLPSIGDFQQYDLHATVKAKYTFGGPVKGIVDVRIKPARESHNSLNRNYAIELSKAINGESEILIPVSKLKGLGEQTFRIEVKVTEDLTKLQQEEIKELTLYYKPIEVTISTSSTFKPGLTTDVVVKVSQRDGSRLDNIFKKTLKVTTTEYRKIPLLQSDNPGLNLTPLKHRRSRFTISRHELPPKYYRITYDGYVSVAVDVTSDVYKLKVKAEYRGIYATKVLKSQHSPSNNFIKMTLLSTWHQVGQSAEILVKSTTPPGKLHYQIYSRGRIVESGIIEMKGLVLEKYSLWKPRLTEDMAPRAKIVAFFVQADGELIVDTLTIDIRGPAYNNKVDVKFSTYSSAPAGKIQLDVTADPGSQVYLLAVDKSLLQMTRGNDITHQQVEQELELFDTVSRTLSSSLVCDRLCRRRPTSVGAKDARDVFEDVGLIVITDALVYDHLEQMLKRRGYNHNRRTSTNRKVLAAEGIPSYSSVNKHNADTLTIRQHFPETWLWHSSNVGINGSVSIFETVPDTITSWIASAFAVHPATGLGVANPTPNLRVTLPFFISMNLPYSVIRGEHVMIQVTLHNYSPEEMSVWVTFLKSDVFKNILIKGKETFFSSIDISKSLKIPADGVGTLYFPILPEQTGMIELTVTARANTMFNTMSDAVTRKLLVEPEGTPMEYNIPILADLDSNDTVKETVQIIYPAGKVQGSEAVTATVIGDLMGPSINGLDKLLKLPYGCGEQNMLNFAPNIFIIKYLEATHTASGNTMKKAKEFMEKGYQRELRYSHPDGSFSAFGDRDPSGSTWLTAFVLKSFVQAKPYIFIDDNVINKAIEWLIKQQQPDGTFNEPGRVINNNMQGGSIGRKVSLTAYVLISLMEARVVDGVDSKISSVVSNAITYLEGKVPQTTDVYDLAIMSYALQLGGSTKADLVWNKLDAIAKTKAATKYWEKVSNTNDVVAEPWKKRDGVAVNIELTSYALLTLVQRNDRTDGVKVLKWVTEQRNPNGGFSSTQDTVLALQGLAEMAALIYSPNHDVTVTISGTGFHDTINVNDINAGVLQTRDLPSDIDTVTVTATGSGLTFIQFGVRYNIDTDEDTRSFDLTVTIPQEAFHFYHVKACARWVEPGPSSMTVLEIHSVSGFTADVESVVTQPTHKRIDTDSHKLILYFDEIDRIEETCASVSMLRTGLVANAKPVVVRIYNYYEPTQQLTSFYIPQSLQYSEVCGLCGEGCDVCGQ